MGIPIDFSLFPSPEFTPGHSAKSSWSSQNALPPLNPVSSSSSPTSSTPSPVSSSSTSSLSSQQPLQYQQHQRIYHNRPYVSTTNSGTSSPSSEQRGRRLNSGVPRGVELQNRTLSSSSSLSPSPATTLPSFLQGAVGSTTVVQAHPLYQGVILIYPENHDPIYMYGRPVLTPPSTSPAPLSSSPLLSSSPPGLDIARKDSGDDNSISSLSFDSDIGADSSTSTSTDSEEMDLDG